LIFDEIVTGFRLANGGAQEFFSVTPDLACFGKALANGMPLSVIVGRREYMEYLPSVAYGMTYRDETLSLAAAREVLRILQAEPVTQHLARVGEQIREMFHEACAREGVRARLTGPPARMTFGFEHHGSIPFAEVQAMFLSECAKHGVLSNGNLLASHAHDDEAVRRTRAAFIAALEPVGRAVREGGEAVHSAVQEGFGVGQALEPSNGGTAELPAGHIDVIGEEGGMLKVWGWILLSDGGPDAVEFVAISGESVPAQMVKRPDVAEFFQGTPGAEDSGYAAALPPAIFAEDGRYEFEIRARIGEHSVFRCNVVRPTRSGTSALHVPHRDGGGVLYV
jgi:hypothetical protein